MWNRKYFLWYYVFSSQMRHLCGSLCILVYKNADVDNFYTKSRSEIFYAEYVLKNIFCDITYFPHKCATFVVPFVFWFKKCWRYYNVCLCGTENIFCDITYFPHKCATFVVPFVFWFTKMLTLTIFTQNRWGVWLKFLYRFKGYYTTENIFCDITYFPHKCATFVVLFVFWFTKMLSLTIFTQNREEYG